MNDTSEMAGGARIIGKRLVFGTGTGWPLDVRDLPPGAELRVIAMRPNELAVATVRLADGQKVKYYLEDAGTHWTPAGLVRDFKVRNTQVTRTVMSQEKTPAEIEAMLKRKGE